MPGKSLECPFACNCAVSHPRELEGFLCVLFHCGIVDRKEKSPGDGGISVGTNSDELMR